MTKTFYAVHYKKILKDGSIREIGTTTTKKEDLFENFKDAAFAANKMNEYEWKFHQDRIGNAFYFVVEIQIPEELLK